MGYWGWEYASATPHLSLLFAKARQQKSIRALAAWKDPAGQYLLAESLQFLARLLNRPVMTTESHDETFTHLPDEAAVILSRQIDSTTPVVKCKTLFRYATKYDICCLAVSGLSAIAAGASLPLMTIIYGSLAGTVSCATSSIRQHGFACDVLRIPLVSRLFSGHGLGLIFHG